MKVYKFGGAAIKSAEGVRNLREIVVNRGGSGSNKLDELGGGMPQKELFIIISAMGKTTNAMEQVVEQMMKCDTATAYERFAHVEQFHTEIASDLFGCNEIPVKLNDLFAEIKNIIDSALPKQADYDAWYDRIVSYGELFSSTIVSEYLTHSGVSNQWMDMRRWFITDGRHRDANIDIECSEAPLKREVEQSEYTIFVGQGFIGATAEGATTTLGREGSDYSAAVAAYILDAQNVTIWKDVVGVLNADPKIFDDAVHIPELTYLDAIELAYSGAQIIHPKTIKPLQNKNIPLYVRPFDDITKTGSVIKGSIAKEIDVPILILKHNQVLLSIRPLDFSFVLEDRFATIFSLLESYRVKINLIQSSAVNLSLSVDNSRYLPDVVERLMQESYRVVYNSDMELLTIRGYTPALFDRCDCEQSVYLTQKTRNTVRFVRKVSDKSSE